MDGKNITARDANGNEMPYRYSKTYPAQDGDDVYVTIDMTLQTYLENAMTDMVNTYKVAKRGAGIILNAKTGAVMAMASVGGFDPNEPYEIYDTKKAAEINRIAVKEDHDKALDEARYTQWRNKCVTETYIPGSVFKVFTGSAALEENKVDYYKDRFNCVGQVNVAGTLIHCSHTNGHGVQTYEEILSNSCNPAFIELGQRLGKEQFCKYFGAFGLTERTGIDLPAEANPIYTPVSKMGPVELAASSYGQNNSLTPIEMVTGFAAVVNGGSSTFNSAQTECSDVNGDNNIDSSDASVILVYYAESVNNGYAAWPSYLENKIKRNSDGLFIADRTLLGKTRSQISSSLGTIIPAPVDFPYWGIGLSNSDCTINGVDVCFMFQNEKCVMIIHDEMTPINKNVFNAAVKFYNDKSAVYSDFSKKGSVKVSYNCTYEIYEDVYATSGQTVYHQQYVSSSMVR